VTRPVIPGHGVAGLAHATDWQSTADLWHNVQVAQARPPGRSVMVRRTGDHAEGQVPV